MAINIDNPEIESGVVERAALQPARTSKTAMVEAILRRALQQTHGDFQRWLSEVTAPNSNTPAPEVATTPAETEGAKA